MKHDKRLQKIVVIDLFKTKNFTIKISNTNHELKDIKYVSKCPLLQHKI